MPQAAEAASQGAPEARDHGPRLTELLTASEGEIARIMQICNACRYCEGFCAVFPAMTRRLEFGKSDVHYLANLCHNCGSCLYACQYAPPHEFAVNVPQAMAKVRVRTYQEYAWPAAFGKLYERAGLTVALALAGGLALFMALAIAMKGRLLHEPLGGNFYAVFPHNMLALVFGAAFLFAIVALTIGVVRFWRDVAPAREADTASLKAANAKARLPAAAESVGDIARLKYLGGGHGDGCNEDDDAFTHWRRRFHQMTLYGFLLCFASTSVATLYHYVYKLAAPYDFASAPVILGTVGGIGLIAGPAGLLWLNWRRSALRADVSQNAMDRGFILLLLLVSVTGLVLLALRDTSLMGLSLAIHLGCVMALFVTLPYGKFAHGVFRAAALLKFNIEKRMPNRIALGSD